jgi:polyphosphate kinase
MTRNLSQRVEVVAPVTDHVACEQLWEILEVSLKDRRQAWLLGSDGAYTQLRPEGVVSGPESQGTHQTFMDATRRRCSECLPL